LGRFAIGAAACGHQQERIVSNQGTSNSSRLLIIGAAVLLVGVILVMLVLRNDIGNDGQSAADPTPLPTTPAPPPDPRAGLVGSEQAATARLGDLEFDEGFEAAAMRVTFIRGVAAIVVPGDRLNIYSLAEGAGQAPIPGDPAQPAQPTETETDAEPTTPAVLPTPTAATRVLTDIEVLGIIGPRPAANDGVLTLILAIPSASVESTLELANVGLLWATLLPSADEPTDAASGGASEGAADS
jgi:hypothetical protein